MYSESSAIQQVSADAGTQIETTLASASAPMQDAALYIAGIGASAGGLEALERLFRAMPADTGVAFVIVQHLSPDFKSVMDELLARHTRMPIHRVENGMTVRANSIYLIPPKKEMIISGGRLLLTDKDPAQDLSLPIDHFFRSLASDAADRAIAIVLSGTGSDGSRGIRDVHEAGGLVIAQTESTAKFDGMPKSARDTGVVDAALTPEEMPRMLIDYLRQHSAGIGRQALPEPSGEHGVDAIFKLLRDEYQIDFSYYKPNTVTRRIERRLSLNQSVDLEDYVNRLRSDPSELNSLYRDLLIGVTRFFRDREAFDYLPGKRHIRLRSLSMSGFRCSIAPSTSRSSPPTSTAYRSKPPAPGSTTPKRWPKCSRSGWIATSRASRTGIMSRPTSGR
jgi:two-component system CheB/CheR fusion protein